MTQRNAASERQVQAADPTQSTWLSANAGSGKTRVLTDRVARLLMAGTQPQRILCLTYTKAAATEMQNRLFRRLGEWAMLDEAKLRVQLQALGIDGPIDRDTLANARRLFARAIETPGGLKIQTIHSFCATLLRRFPLEAQISPDFVELDDRAAKLLREDIVDELAGGADVAAVDAVAGVFTGEDFSGLLNDLCRNRALFDVPMTRDAALGLFGLPQGYGPDDLLAAVFRGGEAELLAELVPLLLASSPNDVKDGKKLEPLVSAPLGLDALAILENVCLFGEGANSAFGAKISKFPTKGLAEGAAAPLMPRLEALMLRVEAARKARIALAAAEKTLALHRFAGAFLPRYAARKAARSWLDFDDLIDRAAALLSDSSVAQWVLYRLDGGIDHVLVDEAQDTSPGQWKVIERLTEEFTTGKGARDALRTVFVVGDKKQSIYSFQGADLGAFDKMQVQFSEKFAAVGLQLQKLGLEYSFRSADSILRLVDLTFDHRAHHGLGGQPEHLAFRDMPGRVDLWHPVPLPGKPDEPVWYAPVDTLSDTDHSVVLARTIAAEIRRIIDAGTCLPTEEQPRRVDEGDFLILVQRRSDLFAEIIRACKAAKLNVAGADRLKLGAELAVRDLAALLNFLALQEDDLSLATALRSPLFGWSEAQLYNLAQPRPRGSYLWEALRARAENHAETMSILHDLRDQADFLRPFELIERVLTRHDGRRRLIARLGPEAEDGIDEMLTQALAYERTEVPSLTGFLVWLETDEVEVKRQLDTASRAIRVMTVHGAKGLEAPIVILPDTAKRQQRDRDEIYRLDETAAWKTPKAESPAAIEAARAAIAERQRDERMRLLYVAMTRAESWLIVCGSGDVGTGEESWYGLVADGMARAGGAQQKAEGDLPQGTILRLDNGVWPADGADRGARRKAAPPALPDWATRRAPDAATPEAPLSPSALGGAKALPGEAGRDEATAKARGTHIHLLLEHLSGRAEDSWRDIAEAVLCGADPAFDPAETDTVLAEAGRALRAPAMADLVAAGSLAEVELTSRLPELGGRLLHGTVDRLLVTPDRVLAVDYKSNMIVPDRPEAVPEGILRQMGAYAAMLAQIYPDRRIETAIFWTVTGQLMPLSPDIVRSALHSTAIP
jgi:ATP-dependent helicase/nuclease subunit A